MHQPPHTSVILTLEGAFSFSPESQRSSPTPLLQSDVDAAMEVCLVPRGMGAGWVGCHLVLFGEGSAFGSQGLSAAELPYPRLAWITSGTARSLVRELHRWLVLGDSPRATCVPVSFTVVVVFMAVMMGSRRGHVMARGPQLQEILDATIGVVTEEEAESLVQGAQKHMISEDLLESFCRTLAMLLQVFVVSAYSPGRGVDRFMMEVTEGAMWGRFMTIVMYSEMKRDAAAFAIGGGGSVRTVNGCCIFG